MADLERLSFTIERPLLERLEKLREKAGYENRSEYLRDLIRDRLVKEIWDTDPEREVVGTVTLVYDHDKRQLSEKLTDIQHDHHHDVLVSTHVHLSRHMCAEVVVLRGKAAQLRHVADALRQQKGVLHGEFTMTSTGDDLK